MYKRALDMSFKIAGQTLDKNISISTATLVFSHFEGKFSVIKLSVSIFGQTTGYRIHTLSREPIRLPEMQHPVFGI